MCTSFLCFLSFLGVNPRPRPTFNVGSQALTTYLVCITQKKCQYDNPFCASCVRPRRHTGSILLIGQSNAPPRNVNLRSFKYLRHPSAIVHLSPKDFHAPESAENRASAVHVWCRAATHLFFSAAASGIGAATVNVRKGCISC